jgi:hypothetical protein
MMCTGSRILVMAMVVGAAARTAQSQSEILDLDALGQEFSIGQLTQDRTELVYVREDLQGGLSTLLAASLVNPGAPRQLPTQGINVGQMRTIEYGGRILVSDFVNNAVYAVDLRGDSPPLPLSPEPGTGGSFSPASGQVALSIGGDRFSTDPELRDQLYTRSILGGPAVEITGGVPQLRDISAVDFTDDGNTLVVGTALWGDNDPIRTSEVFFATPGVTGMTPILDFLPGDPRHLPLGSDSASDYFAFFTHDLVSDLWSVPVANPAAAVQLNLRSDETFIAFDDEVLDPHVSRMLFTSAESEDGGIGQKQAYSVWEAPLDGSTPARILGKLSRGQEPIGVIPTAGSPWVYVVATEGGVGTDDRAFAIHSDSGQVVEFSDPTARGVNLFTVAPDGSAALFSDKRASGNDLYLGRPDATTAQVTLLDVPDTDRLVRVLFTPDGEFAIAALVTAPTSTTLADRLLALPLDGGQPITLEDGTVGPLMAQISNAAYAPTIAGDLLFYLKGYGDGQAGFYVVDLPSSAMLAGDYNGDGNVDAADYVVWRRHVGAEAGTLSNDVDGGVIGAAQYETWRENFGRTAPGAGAAGRHDALAVPEPTSAVLLALITAAMCAAGPSRHGDSLRRDGPAM